MKTLVNLLIVIAVSGSWACTQSQQTPVENQIDNNLKVEDQAKSTNINQKDAAETYVRDEKEPQQYIFTLPYHLYSDGGDFVQIDLNIYQDSTATTRVEFHAQEIDEKPEIFNLDGHAKITKNDIQLTFNKNYASIKDFFIPEESKNNFSFKNDSTIMFDKLVKNIAIVGTPCYNWDL